MALPPARAAITPRALPQRAAARPLRILLAEDNVVNQQVAVGLLQQQGHQVEVVPDGRAAVAAARTGTWDVVLVDAHMPVMDGLTATSEIRRLPGAAGRVPIVAMSASVAEEETRGFLAAGMNGYVAKPIDPAALAATLAGLPNACPDEPGPAPAAAPAPDALDEAHLQLLLDALGAAKLAELIDGVETEIAPHCERLAAACASGDLATACAASHALKGIAASLGMRGLAELSGAIEQAAGQGEAECCAPLAQRLDHAVGGAVARLRTFCAGHR